ncbi:ABC transporter permease [Glaciimonas sp. Gout2]|uniref:ABC transporter permease n=1 Tax=unclassified Glaciimonas TaxID=2644401 RepID=UPI002B238C6C|nr:MULTISPECIES: ABC transporter permease [unclassified Glaciimonas]MEB0014385.1 ABC transporter permease [Glaciimonas sp. Cout2]MEB0084343.1 ABC transporter permease [Glaciimonas sp. Gout2]
MKRNPMWIRFAGIGVLAMVIGLWWLASTIQLISPVFLPTPKATLDVLWDGVLHGETGRQTLATVERMVYGWLLASLAGILLGAIIGVSPTTRRLLQPTLEFIRPLPASAIIPVAISLFGLTESMVLSVIGFGAIWPVLLATVNGFASVEPRLGEVARVLHMSRIAFIIKIGLPNALPDIFAGLRLSLTVALIVAVVGEMLTSQQGLGLAILLAARTFQSAELFAGIALLGMIGFLSNLLLRTGESRVLAWKTN